MMLVDYICFNINEFLRKVIDNYFKRFNETTQCNENFLHMWRWGDKYHLQSQKINIINSLVSSDLLMG